MDSDKFTDVELPNPYTQIRHRVEVMTYNENKESVLSHVDFELEFYYFKTGPNDHDYTRMFFWKPKGARLDYSQAVTPEYWEAIKKSYEEQDKQKEIK